MLIQVITPGLASRIRAMETIVSHNKVGADYAATPQKLTIIKRGTHCHACGCPLDIGVTALRVLRFTGYESRQIPTSYCYVHADDCWREGFIQTLHFNREIKMRAVRKGCVIEASYTINSDGYFPDCVDGIIRVHVQYELDNVVYTGLRSHAQLLNMQNQERRERAKAKYEAKREARRARYTDYTIPS